MLQHEQSRVNMLRLLIGLVLVLAPAAGWAQRVVVLVLHPHSRSGGVVETIRQTADLGGAQALVFSRVASSPWVRDGKLAHERWERSAYLTLNAGTRALVPEQLPSDGIQRFRQLVQANRRWGYPVVIGLLPQLLKTRGVSVRYLVADRGSPALLAGAPFPEPNTRVIADFRALLKAVPFIVQRHTRLMLWLDPGVLATEQLREVVATLRRYLVLPSDKIYMLLPIPSVEEARQGARLGWVMRLGREDEGVLVSRSTRLPGLVTLPDLTATWLAHFNGGHQPDELLGSPASTLPNENPTRSVIHLYLSLSRQWQWNRLVGTLPTVQVVVLVAAWLAWYRWGRVVRALWLFPCLVPVLGVALAPLLICLPLGGISLAARAGIWAVVLVGLLAVLSRYPLRIVLRGLATLLLIFVSVDLLRGGNLLRWSGFGYVLMEGARYYGVGNELAGSLIGAQTGFLLAESALWSVVRWLLTAMALGAPFWGANVGAMLSALGVAVTHALRSRTTLIWSGVGIVILVAAVVLWEAVSPARSHLGAFLSAPSLWASTLQRKALMNGALLVSSAWTPLLLFGLTGLRGAPVAVWVAALSLLVLNDSGVVASAAMLVWWWAWRVSDANATAR